MSHPTEIKELYPSSPLGDTEGDIPTGRDVEWEPLVDYRRNGVRQSMVGKNIWLTNILNNKYRTN